MKLSEKTALITGASKGIGKAVAISLAREGATVIINYCKDANGANDTLKECNKYSKGNITIQTDITKENNITEMFKNIKKTFSKIDILINNAGIYDNNDSPISIEAFDNIYKNNLLGHIMITKHALELMEKGKIVNISSAHGKLGHGNPQAIAYSAFKAALESYTKNLAKSLAPKILVNAVAPGRVITPMWDNPNEKQEMELGQAHLILRMIKPEEIADAVLFLLKNDAMCGEVLTIEGGMTIKTLG